MRNLGNLGAYTIYYLNIFDYCIFSRLYFYTVASKLKNTLIAPSYIPTYSTIQTLIFSCARADKRDSLPWKQCCCTLAKRQKREIFNHAKKKIFDKVYNYECVLIKAEKSLQINKFCSFNNEKLIVT